MDAPCIIVLSTSKKAAAVGSAGGVSAASTSAAAQPATGSTRRVVAARERRRPGVRAMLGLPSVNVCEGNRRPPDTTGRAHTTARAPAAAVRPRERYGSLTEEATDQVTEVTDQAALLVLGAVAVP